MNRRLICALLLPAAALLSSTTAFGDDKAACVSSASKGQKLRSAHKLVAAREELRACAAAACPAVVQSDCASWLAEVEKALPSIVVTAKNGKGANLIEVKLSVDGRPFGSRLDGQAAPIDPGSHALHFEGRDGATLDQQIVVLEGEKDQRVSVVLGAPTAEGGGTNAKASSETSGGSGWKTLGWAAGGVGLIGIGVGAVFGAMAMSDNNSAHCNASNQCEPGPLSSARSAAVGSDVGFIAGGVLLAGGIALVLLGPSGSNKEHAPTAPTASIAPAIAPGDVGFVVRGAW